MNSRCFSGQGLLKSGNRNTPAHPGAGVGYSLLRLGGVFAHSGLLSRVGVCRVELSGSGRGFAQKFVKSPVGVSGRVATLVLNAA